MARHLPAALDDTGGSHKDWLAKAAGQLIPARWWADAVVVMPVEESFSYYSDHEIPPFVSVYRLFDRSQTRNTETGAGDGEGEDEGSGVFSGLRRWVSRTAGPPPRVARVAQP